MRLVKAAGQHTETSMTFDPHSTHLELIDRELAELGAHGFGYLPSTASLVRDQNAMLAAFQRHQLPPRLWRQMEDCYRGVCERKPCAAACHFGERYHYLRWVKDAADIFFEDGRPTWWVTIAYARYRTPVGELQTFEPGPMLQVLRRALRRLEAEVGQVRAFGIIKVALSVELDGSRRWDPHPHLLVAGRSLDEGLLQRVFRPSGPKVVGLKPVVAKLAYNDIGALCYAGKRGPMERYAYIGSNGRQARNEHGVSAASRFEHDRWLLSLGKGERLLLYGCKRVHGRIVRLR